MEATLQNNECFSMDSIDESVLLGNPAGPGSRFFITELFWLAYAFKWSSLSCFDQVVDSFEELAWLFLTPQVVLPTSISEGYIQRH